MLLYYFTDNFMTLMILAALITALIVNRSARIPAARYFGLAITLLFISSASDTFSRWAAGEGPIPFFTLDMDQIVLMRTWSNAISYIAPPLIIMLEVFITSPPMGRYKSLLAIPAIFNAAVYATALFGSRAAFWISRTNRWYRGTWGLCVYFVLMFYVFMLALFSVIYFRTENVKRSALVFLIVIQSILVAILEYNNILPGLTSPITALCMLEYYFYLSVIYQNEMRETIAEKELNLTRQQMTLLRNQIQPHFIFNSLSVIRSLAKRDSAKAVNSIDSFSDYLKAHIYFIQENELIPFEKEMGNVKAYLALVQSDSMKNVEVIYDLPVTDFMIPPLTLEPVVENAFKHGTGAGGGQIRISTARKDDSVIITVADKGKGPAAPGGSPSSGMTERESKRLGVGIANTRKRLHMQCKGTLDTKLSDSGSVVTITIPNQPLPPSADSC